MEHALSGGVKFIAFVCGGIIIFFVSAAVYLKASQMKGN